VDCSTFAYFSQISICTIIHDNSKYVCLVHDLTDHGASKEDRRQRVLHYILEVWSLDENSNPVFRDHKFPDKIFEDADIDVNQIWPYLEPVDDSFTFENAWKQDITQCGKTKKKRIVKQKRFFWVKTGQNFKNSI